MYLPETVDGCDKLMKKTMLGSLRRKRVSLGIDFGSTWVRSCIWSTSKRRPDLLEVEDDDGNKKSSAIAGPGTKFLFEGVHGPLKLHAEKIRKDFVNKCAEIFEKIKKAVATHYQKKDLDSIDLVWVVVVVPTDETFYRLALEDAAVNAGIKISQFLSTSLAACLGEWAYQVVRIQQGKLNDDRVIKCDSLVVDVGASATKIGVVKWDGDESNTFTVLSSVYTKQITNTAFMELIKNDLIAQSEKNGEIVNIAEVEAKSREICFELLTELSKSTNVVGVTSPKSVELTKKLQWFKTVNQPLFEKLRDIIEEALDSVPLEMDCKIDKVIMLGGGVQVPGVYKAVVTGLQQQAITNIFYPRWTPNLYILAMGGAVQAGIIRLDKSCVLSTRDANLCPLSLGLIRTRANGKLSIITGAEQIVPQLDKRNIVETNTILPCKVSTKVTGNDNGRLIGIALFEDVHTKDGDVIKHELIKIEIPMSPSPNSSSTGSNDSDASGGGDYEVVVSKFFHPNEPRIAVSVRSSDSPSSIVCSDREYWDYKVREAFQKKRKDSRRVTPKNAGIWPLSDTEQVQNIVQTVSNVMVHIIRAHGLARADTWGKSDPYCVVLFNGEKIGQTTIEKKTLDPVWDQKLYLNVAKSHFDDSDELCLDVYDHDKFSSDDFLGRVSIKGALIGSHDEERWYELGYRDDLPKKKQKFVQGSMAVSFTKHKFQVTESMLDFHQQKQEIDIQKQLHQKNNNNSVGRNTLRKSSTTSTSSSSSSMSSPIPPTKSASVGHGQLFVEESDDSDSEGEEPEISKQDLKLRWRILSGNVPIHGLTITHQHQKPLESSGEAPPPVPPKSPTVRRASSTLNKVVEKS